jgi:hypothetical protein
MTASIAYFIMVHHKPYQFEWLMNAIHHPDDLFLVHVDMKSRLGLKADRRGLMREVRRICARYPNVRIMRSRFTNWGGWSLSKILLDAIDEALASPMAWTHFVNLSGQCYPLKPLDMLRRSITDSGDALHVEQRPIASLPADDWHHDWSPMVETPLRTIKRRGRREPPAGLDMSHKGSQWVILPRAFCEWIRTAPALPAIRTFLSRLMLSDELIMQALARNGPWKARIAPDYRRAIIWPGPKLLTNRDLPYLSEGGAWFGRKFDAAVDSAVLHNLASANGFSPGPLPPG